jgi:hypothetical protein
MMMEDKYSPVHQKERRTAPAERVPEERYAYYRRCQVFRKNGEQCKAPAEKGAHICYAHAGQRAMALRRERERRAVLVEAVAEMRRKGRPEFEMADLFTDFKGINVTLAVMARALIGGRIDCKTAGRLVVDLQTASKLLRICHIGHRGAQRGNLTTKDSHSIPRSQAQGRSEQAADHEEASELRTKAVAKGTGNAESTRNARIVAIRSPERTPRHSSTFWRRGSRPNLLTA